MIEVVLVTDVFYLAWRYLAYHRFKTAILLASVTLIVYLPVGLNILVNQSAEQLTARADATPLLIGAKGSPLELVLSSLYFESDVPPQMQFAEVSRVVQSRLARAIPLHTRFQTRHGPIVGTSLEYFDFRGLEIEHGRHFGMLGECVVGAHLARKAELRAGDSVMSTPESVFDIAGVYPLKMKVVGILRAAGTPDDRAVFVDVKTAWVIEGLAHGHQDLSQPGAEAGVLRKEGNAIVANASVIQYNEITPENVDSFHFHGDPADFPVTSIVVVPDDERSGTLLQGRYLGDDERVQIVQPAAVMDELLQTILTVRRYILIAVALIATATLASMALVFLLSLQLRRREMETIVKLGGSRLRIGSLIITEILSVVAAGILFAAGLSLATVWLATSATRLLVQMA
jgi:putative ABC transport system permease protein